MISSRSSIISVSPESRRFGASLEINILGGMKICSFDCLYCCLGPTEATLNYARKQHRYPTADEVLHELKSRLKSGSNLAEPLQALVLSGFGEPTLHPQFVEICDGIMSLRDEFASEVKVVGFTNGAHLDKRKIVSGLNMLDERLLKLDAGRDLIFQKLNRPLSRVGIESIIQNARKLSDVIVDSLFMKATDGQTQIINSNTDLIEEWMEAVGIIQPKLIHLSTLNQPSWSPNVTSISEDDLYTVSALVKRRLNIDCLIFPESPSLPITA